MNNIYPYIYIYIQGTYVLAGRSNHYAIHTHCITCDLVGAAASVAEPSPLRKALHISKDMSNVGEAVQNVLALPWMDLCCKNVCKANINLAAFT